MSTQVNNLNLAPFRRRIRLLRAWRCAAIGGTVGAGLALVMAALDFFSVHYSEPWMVAVPVLSGLAAGAIFALVEHLPDHAIAMSVDRRGHLEDRLTTATEVDADSSPLAGAAAGDAASHAAALKPKALYPFRAGRWQAAALAVTVVAAILYAMGNAGLFRSPEARKESAALKHAAPQVERVMRPVLEQAKRSDATLAEKNLARHLQKFTSDLKKGRITREEAMVRANKLAADARRAEQTRAAAANNTIKAAQTAGSALERTTANSLMAPSEAKKQADQAAALQQQMAQIQRQLAAGKGMSAKERADLEKKLAQAGAQLQQIRLSQQAQQTLARLQANPDFQKAQRLLQKLAEESSARQAGEQGHMTDEQMKEAARQLEELAKSLNTDAKMREYAKQLMEAAKNAQSMQSGVGAGLMGAMGMGGGMSMGGSKGAGSPTQDQWVGAHGHIQTDDKSSLLHVKLQDRIITSQQGEKGPETYIDTMGPATPTGKSSVPYESVLPKYEKTAESALKKTDIPPAERARVRSYFDSLRK